MVELRVLGAVDITGVDAEAASGVVRQPKRLALVTYLAIESRRGFARRDSLLAMFWPESNADRGRHALRQALHVLRRTLGAGTLERRGEDDVAVNRESLRCDAVTFESLLDDGRTADALALYDGDLLPGVFLSDAPAFERWLDESRQRLRERAMVAAQTLERAAETTGDLRAAVTWARRALRLSPHDESAARRLLIHLDRLGDRAAAVDAYDLFAQRLATDLELAPSPETQALLREVRARAAGNVHLMPTGGEPIVATPAAAAQALLAAPATAPGRKAVAISVLALLVAVIAFAWRTNVSSASAPGVPSLKSTIARRFYDEAMSASSRGDLQAAERLTLAAYNQDSTFALALFTYGDLLGRRAQFAEGMRLQKRAVAMAPQQPDHDRLLILTWFAQIYSDPLFPAYAETLAIRYPDDLQGQLFVAQGRRSAGDYLGSIMPLRRIVEVDRRSLRGTTRARCFACRAFPELVNSYENLDSLASAEVTAREWIRESPRDPEPWGLLVYQLSIQGRFAEALAAEQRREDLGDEGADLNARGEILMRSGDLDEYERLLLERLRVSAQRETNDIRWKYWYVLRYQGRMREALAQAPLMQGDPSDDALANLRNIMRAQSYLETGQFALSARLLDSAANTVNPREPPAQAARFRVWIRTRMSEAVGQLRDTIMLKWLADTIRSDGARSGLGRDRRLYHHVLGLLGESRGDFDTACDEYRQALLGASPMYSRTNIAIGRVCVAAGRPQDAVRPLYNALHGPIGAQGTYATMTEVHEQLGALHRALGNVDSARYWFARAERAWKRADPEWLARPERFTRTLRTASSVRPPVRPGQD